jgi:transposase
MLGGTTVCRSASRKHAGEILQEASIPCVAITHGGCLMDVVYTHCCGLDLHKRTVVACLITTTEGQEPIKVIRTFRTMTSELLALADWLREAGCTHVAMESTGVYWRPVYNLLEGQCELLVVNAQHIKAVPGRKTDVKDAEWIAELLRHGLLRGSFSPPKPQRQLRELTRYRSTLVQDRARTLNRLQAVLEDANLKLASVVTDIYGVSARAMLAAILAGQRDVDTLADLARGRLRAKRDQLKAALEGRVTAHHSFLLTEHLSLLESLDEAIARVSGEIDQRLRAVQEAIALLDTLPGVGQRAAEILIAEIGTDMSRFPSAKHLASWAGMCPGNSESAGKRLSGKTRKGSRWLRQVLVEIAQVASKTKNTYLAAQYRRIAARRGKKRALIAVGHTILTIVYTLLTRQQPYQDLGAAYFDQREQHRVERRLVQRLERLGYAVSLQPRSLAS